MAMIPIDSQMLAEITVQLLAGEEQFLGPLHPPRSSRQYRECDVQFLLSRELLGRGYDVWQEEGKVDLTVRHGQNVIATIELKGPWTAKQFRNPDYLTSQCEEDFRKHSVRVLNCMPGECYSIWILHGPDEGRLEDAFARLVDKARKAAHLCSFETAISRSMPLNQHPESDSRIQRVYVVGVHRGVVMQAPGAVAEN
jgi:hypothetical protein